jgi:hypothetical protein
MFKSRKNRNPTLTNLLDKLKLDIGPIPTFDFVNLVLRNKNANLIQDFQRKFNLKNALSLLHVINFLRCPQFCLSKFKENAIYNINQLNGEEILKQP